ENGHEVILIARGAHAEAIRTGGLHVLTPDEDKTIAVPVVTHPSEITFRDDDVVLMAMKSQHTADALAALAAVAPPSVAIACLQNGVDNERMALRTFADVYAICVMCPATHLRPGEVRANSSPTTGLFDIGRYPTGTGARAEAIAAAFRASTFESIVRPDI